MSEPVDTGKRDDDRALRDSPNDASDPLLYTAEGHSVSLRNWYRGRHVFFVGNGPSLKQLDLEKLNSKGIVTAGINNGWFVHRPDLWFCVDDPGNFADVIWKDPGVVKFVPMGKIERKLRVRRGDGGFRESKFTAGQMPACWFYRRNTKFNHETYLTENTINWGTEGKMVDSLGIKGSRSVMLAAMRLLIYLGFSHIYLVGCDFRMALGEGNYAFEQDRTPSSVKGNNTTFEALNKRFASVWPEIKKSGVKIWNCYEGSGLKVFPHLPFEDAVLRASKECSKEVSTKGWYDKRKR